MAKAAADYGATALITNHTEFDNAFFKAHAADDRKNGEANPFDVGADGVARYFTVVQDVNCRQFAGDGQIGVNMNLKNVVVTALAALCTIVLLLPESRAQNGSETKKGSREKIKVHGKSLKGNLEGDSSDRDVFVYLPPSYATTPNRRYPVVYFLHGYAAHAENYWNMLSFPQPLTPRSRTDRRVK